MEHDAQESVEKPHCDVHLLGIGDLPGIADILDGIDATVDHLAVYHFHWNTPFLLLGYFLRDSGYNMLDVGFWVSGALIGTELFLVLGVRFIGVLTRRARRPSAVPLVTHAVCLELGSCSTGQ